MFDAIKELGLSGWQAVWAIGLIVFGLAVAFRGWPSLIVHKHYYDEEEIDEDEE